MKKVSKLLPLLLISVFSLSSCGSSLKKADGINMLWADQVGYLSRAATSFDEGDTRYVIYETNSKKNNEEIVFALKTAKKVNDVWIYSKSRSVILEPSSTGWDKFIFSPSVIKGDFAKDSITYHYLLAYGGRKQAKDQANQVGLAYAETMAGPWIKLTNPIITYDAETSGDEYGAGAPSLLSYDKQGKVRLFYSYAETNLANERVVDCDFSNLNNPLIDPGFRHISVDGLRDNTDNAILSNADFALDENGLLYVTRDVYPLSGNTPGNATSIQTASANVKILNNFTDYFWVVQDTLTSSMTIDYDREDSMGWDEIYSPCFITDPYGVISSSSIEIIYSTSKEPEVETDMAYKWSANLALHTI